MPSCNKQMKASNIDNFLSQINKNMGPDTIVKLKCRAANCLVKVGSIKSIQKGIDLYNEAYEVQNANRGHYHTRTINILNNIIKYENRIIQIKNGKKIAKMM